MVEVRLGFSVYGSINEIPISDKDPRRRCTSRCTPLHVFIYKQRVLADIIIYIHRHAGAYESISRGTRSVCGWFLINIHGSHGVSMCTRIYIMYDINVSLLSVVRLLKP